jgi:hypothetical protein
MVETITPMVHGGSRTRWGAALAIHVLASTAVAGAFGAVLATFGRLLGAPWGGAWWPALAIGAFGAGAHELFATPFAIPQLRRQVPDWWRTFFGPYAAAALYGGALGVGFLTFVTRATLVVVAAAVIASGEPVVGAMLMAPFGFARALGAVAAGSGDERIVDRLARVGGHRTVTLANAAAVGLVGLAAIVAHPAVEPGGGPRLAGAVLAVAFGWGAAWKVVRPAAWRRVLRAHRLGRLGAVAAVVVPVAEAAVPVLWVIGRPDAAAALAAALLVAGAGAVIRTRLVVGPRVACGCFGEEARDHRLALARNAALVAVAWIASAAPPRAPVGLSPPAVGDLAPIVPALVGTAAAAWALVAARRALRGAAS